MKYVRLCKSVKDFGKLVPDDAYLDKITSDGEWYVSTYHYTDEQYKQFQKTGSVKGIRDVTTESIWWDFDDEENPENARRDAAELLNRLEQFNIKNPEIYFSGFKGFHVVVKTTQTYTPKQVQAAALKIGEGLPTLDLTLYDPPQIFRIAGTLNRGSGLYKIPLTSAELRDLNLAQIKEKAASLENVSEDFDWTSQDLPQEFFVVQQPKATETVVVNNDVSSLKPPAGWKLYKWALAEGFFEGGERNHALTIIAATCRGLGYDKDTTYYICKSALKKQAARSGTEEFAKEELWKIIDGSVFSPQWQGGQFSPLNDPWLASYCKKMGIRVNSTEEKQTTDIVEAFSDFKNYALNIDDLTIKTGIPELDRRVRMTVGMSLGLVASPGVGKTSFAIQLLNNMSRDNQRCIFFSYDMYGALVIQKLVQRHFGLASNKVFERFQEDERFHAEVLEKLKDEYKNVDFCFKTGQTVEDMLDTIKESEDKSGEKIKFMVMDYNELVITDKSDPTQSSAYVAQKMRELATTQQMAVLSLFQPSKMSGLPSDEIKSYHSAKGSSAIAQSVSVMLGMSRPGFNPRKPDTDIFTNLACLKNRMGELFSHDFHFDGLRGMIREMTEEERLILDRVREAKAMAETGGSGGDKDWQ